MLEEEYKRDFQEDETTEFVNEAFQYDLEFPIPPQEKNMKKFKWTMIALLVAGLILFSQSARAAGTEDVVIGAVMGFILGNEMGRENSNGTAGYIDLSKYNIQMVAPDGTLVLTPITTKQRKKIKEPPCARSTKGNKGKLHTYRDHTGKWHYYQEPVCPNWSMPYGGLIVPGS